jgi:branched-chain amino acid transport system ATP-binding protein
MTLAPEPALRCAGLSKSFGALLAVRDISLVVAGGEILGLVGPNGAGKTTLFNLLSGHIRCDRGAIHIGGADITALPAQQRFRRGLARTFQIPEAFGSQTVFDNALAGAVFGANSDRLPFIYGRAAKIAADEALSVVGLAKYRSRIAGSLSPFDKKRLMIGSAIAGQCQILLLDEPFGGLSEDEIDTMGEIIRVLNRGGMTIVIVEHVLRALFKLTRHLFVMQHGEKIFEGTPDQFMENETVIASYLGKTHVVRRKTAS